jgi:DNA-binding NarL/FixJ family response regulator
VGEVETGEQAVTQAESLQPSVVILDLQLSTLNGIQVTKLIKLQCPSIAVVGLTAGEPRHEETQLILAGPAALIHKADVIDALDPSILEAIRRLKNPCSEFGVKYKRTNGPSLARNTLTQWF